MPEASMTQSQQDRSHSIVAEQHFYQDKLLQVVAAQLLTPVVTTALNFQPVAQATSSFNPEQLQA